MLNFLCDYAAFTASIVAAGRVRRPGDSFNICRGTLNTLAMFTANSNAALRDSRFIDICRCGSSAK